MRRLPSPFLALVALALLGAPSHASAVPAQLSRAAAAKLVGRHVFFATGSAMPQELADGMQRHAVERGDRTDAYYMATFASKRTFEPKLAAKVWHPNLFFVSETTRDAASTGRATLHRDSLHNLGQRIAKDEFPLDTVVVSVSPPDADGNVSLGTTSDLTRPAIASVLRQGGKVIAEVNSEVPHMKGNRIPFSDVTAYTRSDDFLPEFNETPVLEDEQRIATNVSRLVRSNRRTTIQVGIGQAIKGVPAALAGKRKIDIFSEMGGKGLIELASGDAPVARRATFSFIHADNEAYRRAAASDRIEMGDSLVVNDPEVISRQKRMVAINTALQVDFLGNVNAEGIGDKIISFPGGQPDFMKGASLAPDGKAVIALRSQSSKGEPGIVKALGGPHVTTPAAHVDYVVTEWGATKRLRGKSPAFRAAQIISVANPAQRLGLAEQAKEMGILTEAQVAKIKRGVLFALVGAPPAERAELARQAAANGSISAEDRDLIVADDVAMPPGAEPIAELPAAPEL